MVGAEARATISARASGASGGTEVDERTFIETSREAWDRLEAALERSRRTGAASLPAAELRAMYEDYRRTAADLAYAQTHFSGGRAEAHLNRLVGEAHAELYGSSPRRVAALLRFLARGYPQLVRTHWRPVALAFALLFGAVALGYLLAHVNYPLARVFIPEALREGVGDTIEQGGDLAELTAAIAPLLAAGITANNIQVALMAFAGGMTAGVLTTYALLVNGLMLGALAGVFAKAGESLYFWSLIVPHGALELPAIALAGGAGLLLAGAIVSPGDLPRSAALKATSADAVKLVLGAIPLFVVAGVIEGFFTPTTADPAVKIVFGAAVGVALLAYIALPGRGGAGRRESGGNVAPTDVRAP